MTLPEGITPEQAQDCLIAAHEYAARGWRVIPIRPGNKFPVGFEKWQDVATANARQVEAWWGDTHRGYGIGIVTGRESGVWVLDVDVAHGKVGAESFAALEADKGALPEGAEVVTGSNGRHLYFTYEGIPEDAIVRNDAGRKLGRDLDIRGDGGFVVAPPSVHPETGQRYEWEVASPADPADPPAWLAETASTDETPEAAEAQLRERSASPEASPGDRYAAMHPWSEILGVEGWTLAYVDRHGEHYWTRPGKDSRYGASATTGYTEADNLCMFSTSMPNLPPGQWTKLGYVAAMRFGGDMREASLAMVESGEVTPRIEDLFSGALRDALTADTPSAHLPPSGTPERAGEVASSGSSEGDGDGVDKGEPDRPLVPLQRSSEVPPWPVDILPPWIADHCRETAERLQSPLDLSCQFAVGALAAIAMGHVEVKAAGSWVEPVNLYVWCAAHSGAGKSPTEKALMGPLRSWADGRKAATNDEFRLNLSKWKALQRQAKDAEESFAAAKGMTTTEADLAAALNAAAGEPPQPYRLTVDDATPQRLVQLLGQHGRLALVSAEGGLFDQVVSQFGRGNTGGPSVDVYLKAWSGDTIERDRVGADGISESVSFSGALLTMAIAVQPAVIQRYQGTAPELRSRGFFARFMPAIPDASPGQRTYQTSAPDTGAAERYRATFMALADRLDRTSATMQLGLSSGAEALFARWHDELEAAIRPGGFHEVLGEMVPKIRSSVLRLAGLLAICDDEYRTISLDTMRRAIDVGGYWIAHAMEMERTADETTAVEDATEALARRIVKHMLKRGGTTTPRAAWQSFRKAWQLKAVEDIAPAMAMLYERGWIEFTTGTAEGIGTRGAVVELSLTAAGRQVRTGAKTTVLNVDEIAESVRTEVGGFVGATKTHVLEGSKAQDTGLLGQNGVIGGDPHTGSSVDENEKREFPNYNGVSISHSDDDTVGHPGTPAPNDPVPSENPAVPPSMPSENVSLLRPHKTPEPTFSTDDDEDDWGWLDD
ncbi:Prim_Pol domain containing protein [uncultured Caudovirales phage]|uniref:Prim_Pol domain containing protein n=1 Tax=uncultured Caudovirales phage TaxID=2100421 RepID=A0A6J5S1M2_9CAUD|nr:Prim_Pol domain containing protein [uncultured Caudovirales phage]